MTSDVPPPPDAGDSTPTVPPRAFTQGVGTVYQFVGVALFVVMMFICCGSGLLSKATAERQDLTQIGWGVRVDASDPGHPVPRAAYSAQLALSLSVTLGCFLGVALAGLGLGLQAQRGAAAAGAVVVSACGTLLWLVHFVFAVQKLHSALLGVVAFLLFAVFAGLLVLAVGAFREMRRDPPPRGHEVLPADYKVPYSHLYADPPDVRLARELEERRHRLEVQQKELEMLEEKIRRRMGKRE